MSWSCNSETCLHASVACQHWALASAIAEGTLITSYPVAQLNFSMFGRAFDALDEYGRKGLKQQHGATQADGFTISTSPACANEDFNVILPHGSQLDALPSPGAYHTAPIFLSSDPRCPTQAIGGCRYPSARVMLDQQLSLDTELFSGSLLVHIKGYPGTPSGVFRNSKWLGQTVIQGRFKQQIAADDLWVGQELWNKPMLPTSFQKLIFSTAAKMFSSTSRIKTDGDGLGFLNPLLAMANVVNVSRPGEEPDIQQEVAEDVRLMCSTLTDKKGKPASGPQRQKHFDKLPNLAAVHFDSEHVYTFVIGQSILDMMQYRLSLGGLLNLDLCPILNGQPLQMMCKNIKDNKTILSVLVWHERLNYPDGCKATAGSLSSSSRLSTASSCSTLNDRSASDASSSLSSSDCGDDSSSNGGGRYSSGSSSGCSSAGGCCAESPDNCCSSSSSSDGCFDDDVLSDYCSACSQFSGNESAGDAVDVGDALLGDVTGMPVLTPCGATAAAALHEAAVMPAAAPAGTAAAYHVHREPQQEMVAAVRHRKQKRGLPSKRFQAWLKKVLK